MGSGGSLLSFIVRRLLITIPLLILISFAVYSLVLIIPGNPALTLAGGIHSTPATVAKITRQLHLNEPYYRQYLRWLNGVIHGNLGDSLFNPGQSVASGIATRFPVTFTLAVGGMLLSVLIGVPAGIVAGMHSGTARDRLVTVGSSLGVAIPDFWLALLLVIWFAVDSHLLPALGFVAWSTSPWQWFEHLILPWIALGIGGSATIARQVRGALIDTLDQDYMRTAVAKGLSTRVVIGKHALEERTEPCGHHHRDPVRVPAGRDGDHRADLLAAGHRPVRPPGHLRKGPPGDPRRRPHHRHRIRVDQPHRRRAVRLPQPQDPARMRLTLPLIVRGPIGGPGDPSPLDGRGLLTAERRHGRSRASGTGSFTSRLPSAAWPSCCSSS